MNYDNAYKSGKSFNINVKEATHIGEIIGLENFSVVEVGREICFCLNDCQSSKDLEYYEKKGIPLWGHFSKKGFIACNIHLYKFR